MRPSRQSGCGESAIYRDGLADDERGIIRGQEQGDAADLLGLGDTADRMTRQDRRFDLRVLEPVLQNLGTRRTGARSR